MNMIMFFLGMIVGVAIFVFGFLFGKHGGFPE